MPIGEPGGAHLEHPHPNYMAVFYALIVLTILELAWASLIHPLVPRISGLIIMAVIKALLVAMYFMHLKFEGRMIYTILVASLCLAAVLVFALMPDMTYSAPRLQSSPVPIPIPNN